MRDWKMQVHHVTFAPTACRNHVNTRCIAPVADKGNQIAAWRPHGTEIRFSCRGNAHGRLGSNSLDIDVEVVLGFSIPTERDPGSIRREGCLHLDAGIGGERPGFYGQRFDTPLLPEPAYSDRA